MVGGHRSWWRASAVMLLAGLALLLGASPALAHTRLVSSSPADGAAVAAAPSEITLVFNEVMKADFSTITVIGPDGASWQSGAVASAGKSVTTQVRPLGPVGRYEIGYRVLSGDGHPVVGKLAFTLTAPGPGAAAAAAPTSVPAVATPSVATPSVATPSVAPRAAATSDPGGTPIWPWLLGGVAVIAAAVVVALRVSRN